ncbi:porin [Pasteurellaceae bacterium HPA106]|uniref:porin n=1 Tax=Spirabiliibacterium pneumoniae TaxID=221400 RepID=UPI001AACC50E|nr:porin [Spirabiliibacterium pneumoniae]MBE2896174.1 porin [Spirabiliibacterium pneumoniae]
MKKTLVALAVAAVAATSANAAVVYDNDGSKVEVKGSLRLLLARNGDQRGDLKNDGSRLIINAQQQIGNGLSAFGQAQIRFDQTDDDQTFGNPVTNKLFAGLAQDGVGALSFGRQATNGDDVQLGDYAYTWGGNNNLKDSAKKSIKFRSADFNGFSFGLDYIFGNATKYKEGTTAKATDEKNGYGAAVFYTAPLAQDVNLNLAAGYGQDNTNGEASLNKIESGIASYSFASVKTDRTKINWRTAAEVEFGPAALAANYGQSKFKGGDKKLTALLVSGKYTIADTSTIYGEWLRTKLTDAPRLNSYVAGVDYKLHKNVVTYVEFARAQVAAATKDGWKKDHENKYGAGLRVFF